MPILIGAIDTKEEVQTILNVFRNDPHLTIREPTNGEINGFLQRLRKRNIIDGAVDTPREVELLLQMLIKAEVLQGPTGPIDTPAEVKLLMEKLHESGMFQVWASAKQESIPDHSNKNKPS